MQLIDYFTFIASNAHTHTHICLYIYIYISVCVCVYVFPFCGASARISVMTSPFTKLSDIIQTQ